MFAGEVVVPRFRLNVPRQVSERVRQLAKDQNLSISKYLARIVEREVETGWPAGYFEEVIGGWVGEPLDRPEQPGL